MPSSSISQEPITIIDLLPPLPSLPFVPTGHLRTSYCSPSLFKKPIRSIISCDLKRPSTKLQALCNEFNRFVRTHCERTPIGFGFPSVGSGVSTDETPVEDNGHVVVEDDGKPVNGVGIDRPKKVLILMSDTGGGHRASAEAIKAAFNQEFGDEYQVNFISLCSVLSFFSEILMSQCLYLSL